MFNARVSILIAAVERSAKPRYYYFHLLLLNRCTWIACMRVCVYGGTREVQLVLANLCNDVTCMRVSITCVHIP